MGAFWETHIQRFGHIYRNLTKIAKAGTETPRICVMLAESEGDLAEFRETQPHLAKISEI